MVFSTRCRVVLSSLFSSASSFNHFTDHRGNEQLPHVSSLPSRVMPHSSRACAPSRVPERDQSLPHVAALAITHQQEAAEMCAYTESTESVERRRNILGHRDVRASPHGKVVTLLSQHSALCGGTLLTSPAGGFAARGLGRFVETDLMVSEAERERENNSTSIYPQRAAASQPPSPLGSRTVGVLQLFYSLDNRWCSHLYSLEFCQYISCQVLHCTQ